MYRAITVVLLAAGCGRVAFDGLAADASIDGEPGPTEVGLTCPDVAAFGERYACTAEPGLEVELAVGHGCGWLAVEDSSTLAGTPMTMTGCTAEAIVRNEAGTMKTVQWPIRIITRVAQIDVGAWHACALSTAGTVRCWGMNIDGQLGYNDTLDVGNGAPGRSIVDMGDVPVGGTVVQISLGYRQTCALLDTGGVRCWGAGSSSRLGYAHTNDIGAGGVGGSIIDNGDLPLGAKAVRIATRGGTGGCALLETGAVRCWGLWHGYGHNNEVRGTQIVTEGDVPIGTAESIVDIVSGYMHTCVLTQQGNVRCWGVNAAGELGYNHLSDIGSGSGPTIIDSGDVPLGGRAVQISTGDMTTCAVLDSGALRCWGENQFGQLGYDDTLDVGDGAVGRAIVDLGDVPVGTTVKQAWAGEQHTCAVTTAGNVRCWGLGFSGQLGYNDALRVGDGTAGRSIIDMGDVPLGGTATSVVTTDWDTGFSCAIMTSGAVRCWGDNGSGELGLDHTTNVGDGAGPSIIDAGDVWPFGN